MSQKKVCLYARVSTENQSLDNQVDKLEEWAERKGHDWDIKSEKVSSITKRPKFEEILDNLEKYEEVVVTKLDRFARSLQDYVNITNMMKDEGVVLRVIDNPLLSTDDDDPHSVAFRQIAVSFAELERKMIRKRMREGYEKARKQGKVGRPRKITGEAKEKAKKMYENGSTHKYILYILKDKYGVEAGRSALYGMLRREGLIGDEDEEGDDSE